MNKLKGFSLIELAIVLVIVGLIAGAGLGVTNGQIQSARISNTKQKQEAIRLALINYISRNNRLPCPAIASLAPGVAGYGAEVVAPGLCTGTIVNGNVATGVLPWVSLGLSDENGTDGYYNRFTYEVTLSATANMTSKTISGLKGAISTHTGTPAALGAPATGNQSNDCAAGQVYNPCSAVVVIISHGSNGLGAYTRDGAQIALPTGADEIENTNNDSKFVIKDYSTNAANPFDDIIMPLSATDLLSSLTTNGSLNNYTSVMSGDFSSIENAIVTNAIAYKTAPTGAYQYPVPTSVSTQNLPPSSAIVYLPASLMTDPWGKAYTYAIISGAPLAIMANSPYPNQQGVFSITSAGPDGVANNNDDVIAVFSVGDFKNAITKNPW
ncbi:MAG TPA: prepilin-type N-terminal cleavage/methylation domain-containing protein [Methylophilaceae bacterium]|jgi:prepilin-type N-terminal cleavage/methylation domain-containing protein